MYIVPSTFSTIYDVQRYIPHIQPMKHCGMALRGPLPPEALTKEMVLEAVESWQSLSVVPGYDPFLTGAKRREWMGMAEWDDYY